MPPAALIRPATRATAGQPRRTKAAAAFQTDRPPYASLARKAEVALIKGLMPRPAERGAGGAEIADAGTRSDVWADDNSRPRGSHICANVFSNFRRTKYQNSHNDRESTSRRRGGRRQ
jgi:hypothetical protein